MTYDILDVIFIVFFVLIFLTLISVALLIFTPDNDKNSSEEKSETVERNKIRKIEMGAKAAANFMISNKLD